MKSRRSRLALTVGSTAAVATITAALAFAAPVPNGGFESNSFDQWKVIDKGGLEPMRGISGPSGGSWQVYSGPFTRGGDPNKRGIDPAAGLPTPPEGIYGAAVGTSNPGNHILHRVVEANGKSVISLQLAYDNTADRFVNGGGLKAREKPNQQLRVDLLKPGAPIYTLKKSDIVKTLFRSKRSTKTEQNYKKLRATVGTGNYRVRVAEVDNRGEFFVGVDDLKVKKK